MKKPDFYLPPPDPRLLRGALSNQPAIRLHQLHARRFWSWRPVRQAILAGLALLAWPFVSVVEALYATYTHGDIVKRRTQKKLQTQLREQLRLAFQHFVAPKYYYQFELFRQEAAAQADSYLLNNEYRFFIERVLSLPANTLPDIFDKSGDTASKFAALGLPVLPALFVFENGHIIKTTHQGEGLPQSDLIVKASPGRTAHGADLWRFVGAGSYLNTTGRRFTWRQLIEHFEGLSCRETVVIEPRVQCHQDLSEIAAGGMPKILVISAIRTGDSGKRAEALGALLRMPRHIGDLDDSYKSGAIIAPVEIKTGKLGIGSDDGHTVWSATWYDRHPANGVQFSGRIIPFWENILALVQNAHLAHAPNVALVGWEVSVLPSEPIINAADVFPDIEVLQRIYRQPLGNSQLGLSLLLQLQDVIGPKGRPNQVLQIVQANKEDKSKT